jgi:hypothetical protein
MGLLHGKMLLHGKILYDVLGPKRALKDWR